MRLGSKRTIVVASNITMAWLMGVALFAGGQAAQTAKPPMVEDVFKNVQVLKGIPVDEFMGTMGVFSAALGISCEDCHTGASNNWADYAQDVSPRKAMSRRMMQMVTALNKTSFGGRQVVTCYTCHRGSTRPKVTSSLAAIYSPSPPDEPGDVLGQVPGEPTADQILDKYIQALGGAQRLAGLTSIVGKGKSLGYGPDGERPIEVFAKAPNLRTTILHTEDGDNTATFDGNTAWVAAPHRPVPVLALSGAELGGVKLESELTFPARVRQVAPTWRVGNPVFIDDRKVQDVQGTTAAGTLATLSFDAQSGLLVRLIRYANSPVGRLPTQVDYSDYRDVAGVKMPFKWTSTWLDGIEKVELSEIQANVPIDAARFAKPAPSK